MLQTEPILHFFLPTQESTTALGQWLAARLVAGDVVLLSGAIGAGKTHLARAIIQSRLGCYEDVPSPTFTLVQTYNAPDIDIWHADLYRLVHPDEVLELGLDEAFQTAICLIEWPERMGNFLPVNAIAVTMVQANEGRKFSISAPSHPGLMADLRNEWRATLA